MTKHEMVCAILIALSCMASAQSPSNLLKKSNINSQGDFFQQTIICHMMALKTSYETKIVDDIVCEPVINGKESDQWYRVEIPKDILDFNQEALIQGDLYLALTDATWNNTHVIASSTTDYLKLAPPARRTETKSKSTRSVMLVYVSTTDSYPRVTATQFRDGVLDATTSSMKKQFGGCSFGQLNFQSTDPEMIQVTIHNSTLEFQNHHDLALAAQQQAKAYLGLTEHQSLRDMADHVIMCLPPGTGDWVAFSSLNHWRVVLNNQWCQSLSAIMHEMGHNLGLGHSNNNGMSQDFSGYMGLGFQHGRWPRKCFNAHKHWVLGWYQSKTRTISSDVLKSNGPAVVHLAAFVDYDSLDSTDQTVLVDIDDTYFMQYNRAKGFNIETDELANQVTVVKGSPVGGYSEMLAGLDMDHSAFEIVRFAPEGSSLVITVCDSYTSDNGVDVMVVGIGLNATTCDDYYSSSLSFPTFSMPSTVMIIAVSIISCLLSVLLILLFQIRKLSKAHSLKVPAKKKCSKPYYSEATVKALSPSAFIA